MPLRALASLALLALAGLSALPAQAQTGVWSEILTSATPTTTGSGGDGPPSGYCRVACGATDYSPFGTLSDPMFTFNSVDYNVDSIRGAMGSRKTLHLVFDKDMPRTDFAELTLEVGTRTFALTDGDNIHDGTSATSTFRWEGANDPPLWTVGTGIAVRLLSSATSTGNAEGKPSISGTPTVGETLTAATGTIADVDGLPNTFPDDYTFQWLRVDGGVETPINGATSSTYTLVNDDAAKQVKVQVSFSDDDNNDEGPLTSDAWPLNGTIRGLTDLAPVLVKNTGQTVVGGGELNVGDTSVSDGNGQAFTTGSNAAGYYLSSVGLHIKDEALESGETVTAFIHEFDSGATRNVGSEVHELVSPSSYTDGEVSYFAAPANATLDPDETYLILLSSDSDSNDDFVLAVTESDAEDSGGDSEWSIANKSNRTSTERSLLMEVRGTEVLSNDATLSDLSLAYRFDDPPLPFVYNENEDSSAFASDLAEYRVSVVNATTTITVLPTPANPDVSEIEYLDGSDGAIDDAGTADGFQVNLSPGANVIQVKVTSQDGMATEIYTVTVARAHQAPPPEDGKLLTADLTAGNHIGNDFYGLAEILTTNAFGGALAPDMFQYGDPSETYTVQQLNYETAGSGVRFVLDRNLPESGYVLDIGGNAIEFQADGSTKIFNFDVDDGDFTLDNDLPQAFGASVRVTFSEKPPNTATGAPVISGTEQVGETLTASTSSIMDADGLTSATFTYQWIRVDSDGTSNPTDIGTDSSTYTLVADDEGKKIKVQVTFTDDADNDEELESPLTATVTGAGNSPATGAPMISGTEQVGETLTASTSSITDADGLTSATFTYQWIRVDDDGTSNPTDIGTDSRTYTLVADDEGKKIKVKVTFTDDADNDEELESALTATVTGAGNNPATGRPEISDTTPDVDQTLTASTSSIMDADGLTNATFTWQWILVDGSVDTDIPNASTSTYRVMEDDRSRKLKVRVSFTDDAGNPEQLDSLDTATVPDVATGKPRFVSASVGPMGRSIAIVFDLKLLHTATYDFPDTTAFTVEADGVELDVGAVSVHEYRVTITVAPRIHSGQRVTVSYTDPSSGNDSAAIQDSVGNDADSFTDRGVTNRSTMTRQSANTAATGEPGISGTPRTGESLTASTSRIADDDGLSGVSYRYQWIRVDGGNQQNISGATDRRYELTASDEGKRVRVKVSFTDDKGSSESRTSAAFPADGTVQAPGQAPPGPPLNVRVHSETPGVPALGNLVILRWNEPEYNGWDAILRYEYRHARGASVPSGARWSSAGTNRYTSINAPGGTRVAFEVRAVTGEGDGRAALLRFTAQVLPPRMSVADAEANENDDAAVEFTVTLEHAAPQRATVDYATRDGTARAGEDYTATSGTLRFAVGQRTGRIRVPILQDSHDEGSETFTLTLSNPTGGTIADGRATGTIHNTDPMPKAWLARFGRTASDHAVQAIEARVGDTAGAAPESHLTIGGRRVEKLLDRDRLSAPWRAVTGAAGSGEPSPLDPRLQPEGRWARMDRLQAEALGPGLAGGSPAGGSPGGGQIGSAPLNSGIGPAGGSAAHGSAAPRSGPRNGGAAAKLRGALTDLLGLENLSELSELSGRDDPLMGSSFFYSRPGGGDAAGWLGNWSAWGQTAATRFSGADGPLSVDGEVATATLGFDTRRDRWMGGLALAYSEGEGAYTSPEASGGALTSTLTSLHPFARYTVNERTSVWGTLGYGTGALTLTPERTDTAIEADLATSMAAFGGRGVLTVRTAGAGRLELALRSDARFTRTESDAVRNLGGATGDTSRVRLVLEGRGSVPLAGGAVLSPTLEAGLRYDGGDAETGAGLELGGGLGYTAGRIAVQMNVRALLAHRDAAYEEWGASGSVRYTPREDGRGLGVSLGSTWGAAESGVNALWSRENAAGLAQNGAAFEAGQRFEAQMDYGVRGRKGRALWKPYLAADGGEGGANALRLGLKMTSGRHADAGLEIGLRGSGGATSRDGGADSARETSRAALKLSGSVRW